MSNIFTRAGLVGSTAEELARKREAGDRLKTRFAAQTDALNWLQQNAPQYRQRLGALGQQQIQAANQAAAQAQAMPRAGVSPAVAPPRPRPPSQSRAQTQLGAVTPSPVGMGDIDTAVVGDTPSWYDADAPGGGADPIPLRGTLTPEESGTISTAAAGLPAPTSQDDALVERALETLRANSTPLEDTSTLQRGRPREYFPRFELFGSDLPTVSVGEDPSPLTKFITSSELPQTAIGVSAGYGFLRDAAIAKIKEGVNYVLQFATGSAANTAEERAAIAEKATTDLSAALDNAVDTLGDSASGAGVRVEPEAAEKKAEAKTATSETVNKASPAQIAKTKPGPMFKALRSLNVREPAAVRNAVQASRILTEVAQMQLDILSNTATYENIGQVGPAMAALFGETAKRQVELHQGMLGAYSDAALRAGDPAGAARFISDALGYDVEVLQAGDQFQLMVNGQVEGTYDSKAKLLQRLKVMADPDFGAQLTAMQQKAIEADLRFRQALAVAQVNVSGTLGAANIRAGQVTSSDPENVSVDGEVIGQRVFQTDRTGRGGYTYFAPGQPQMNEQQFEAYKIGALGLDDG